MTFSAKITISIHLFCYHSPVLNPCSPSSHFCCAGQLSPPRGFMKWCPLSFTSSPHNLTLIPPPSSAAPVHDLLRKHFHVEKASLYLSRYCEYLLGLRLFRKCPWAIWAFVVCCLRRYLFLLLGRPLPVSYAPQVAPKSRYFLPALATSGRDVTFLFWQGRAGGFIYVQRQGYYCYGFINYYIVLKS